MTFTYLGADLGKTIKHYVTSDSNFEIQYLDGSTASYLCSNNNEEKRLNDLLLSQAIKRDETINVNHLYTISKVLCLQQVLFVFFAISSTSELIMFLDFIIVLISFIKSVKIKYKIKELKKYKMFLEMKDDLTFEQVLNFLDVDSQERFLIPELDINTLDIYPYSVVKTIYKQYKKSN